MKTIQEIIAKQHFRQRESGFALLDVVLAVAIFALGMLALAQLQGNLARSSADANHRTVAANMAEELVETLRGYRTVFADPNNGVWDFQEMEGAALNDTVTRGGIDYTRTVTISNFWWDGGNETYIRNQAVQPPTGLDHLLYPDFKLLRLDVVWDASGSREFRVDDDTTADLGTGGITVYEIISSSPSIYGAHLVSALEEDVGPPVQYNPGDNPDIVALQLNDAGSRFKESTSAQPKTFHEDKVETWFDVVTYSQAKVTDPDDQSIKIENEFLRREQFVAVSCTCEFVASSDTTYGYMPTLWNGVSYTMGEITDGSNEDLPLKKPIGVASKTVQQSAFCSECCRDHHDYPSGSDEQRYNLSVVGSHKHYNRDGDGILNSVAVEDGGGGDLTYVEACRLVRKDGFMRVTQDVRQQTLIGFPEGYLEFDAGVDNYSDYVIKAVEDYYPDQSGYAQPEELSPKFDFPARNSNDATSLGTPGPFYTQQQMRSRSVYTDYLTLSAKTAIYDCFTAPNDDCPAPHATSELEIIPFFDLQMTWLADWVDKTANGLVEVYSQGIKEGLNEDFMPDYDRGLVRNMADDTESGQVLVLINSDKSNTGLTATQAISSDTVPSDELLYIEVNSSAATVPPIGVAVSGRLLGGSKFVNISDLTFSSDLAICGKTSTQWSCVVPDGGATLTISYDKKKTAYICSGLPGRTVSVDLFTTTFDLPYAEATYDIRVSEDEC